MKDLLKAAAGFFTILAISYLILLFSASSDNIKVDGRDAVKIAFNHGGYIVAWAIALAVTAAVIVLGVKLDWSGNKVVIAGVATGLLFALMIFTKPVQIKTDPKSANITTEEIDYLKTKGLQDSNK